MIDFIIKHSDKELTRDSLPPNPRDMTDRIRKNIEAWTSHLSCPKHDKACKATVCINIGETKYNFSLYGANCNDFADLVRNELELHPH